MRQDRLQSGVVVAVPDAYTVPSGRSRTRGRRRATDATEQIANFDAVDAAFVESLTEEMALLDEFEYETTPTRARSTRARSAGEQTLSLDVPVDPGETAIALVEQDGVYSWKFPAVDPGARRRRRSSSDDVPETLRFEIPLSEMSPGAGSRSVYSSAAGLVGRIKGRILKTGTDQILKLLERKVERGLVLMRPGGPETWTRIDDPAQLGLPTDRVPRILLFVHGTFSSTFGSFHALGNLLGGEHLLDDMARRYDAVVGFDHPTLSVDPEQNAVELLELLQRATDGAIEIDAVSYSRGGLVLRSLIETLIPRAGVDMRFGRAIFVGATNEGTALAEPDNWADFLDVYTNLVLGATRAIALAPGAAPIATIVGGAVKGLGVAVKFLVGHTVEDGAIPGLAAMEPDGEFVRKLNSTQPGQPAPGDIDYFAVVSDFEGGAGAGGLANELPRRLLMRAADPIVDRLMKDRPNDLVVDTPSMTAIDVAGGHRVREVLDFGTNSVVYHTVYFTQDALRRSFRSWLGVAEGSRRGRRSIPPAEAELNQVEARIVLPDEVAFTAEPAVEPVAADRPELRVEVLWDDIAEAHGDVYAVGHYVGVMPQRAELALDRVVSDQERADESGDLVLSSLTRSNVLRGELGEISFFPWGGRAKRNRLVAVCGMGNFGPFGPNHLRRLHRSLGQALLTLPDRRTLCTVLIGAGEGAMKTSDAVTQLVLGLGDAVLATGGQDKIRRVRIVELYKSKADEVQEALEELAAAGGFPVELDLAGSVVVGGHGRVTDDTARTLLVRAASRAGHTTSSPKTFEAIEVHLPDDFKQIVMRDGDDQDGGAEESPLRAQLSWIWSAAEGDLDSLIQVAPRRPTGAGEPQRITFVSDDDVYRVSAITDSAAVPERIIAVQRGLIDVAVTVMTDPLPADLPELSELLFRLTLPREFREFMTTATPLIFEVDRHTASIHWEMLASGIGDTAYQPIGLTRPVARQLRTQYSEALAVGGGARNRAINVLVIGDPGDPARQENLPHARIEARRVAAFLRELADRANHQINVQTLIGAPDNTDRGVPAATRFEVLRRLMRGDIDLVHFAGHGDFDPDDQRKTGWLFHDGLLTAGEIERIDRPPSIVVANACLSGRLSTVRSGGKVDSSARGEAGLLPGLADEFFNRGVRNYIGTAWEVDDAGAVEFAQAFYSEFFGPGDSDGGTLGEALLAARRRLSEWESEQPDDLVLWAAYQHYGDPGFRSVNM